MAIDEMGNDTLEQVWKVNGSLDENFCLIYYDHLWREYQVAPFIDCKRQDAFSWYHTDNEQDALDTARAMLEEIESIICD